MGCEVRERLWTEFFEDLPEFALNDEQHYVAKVRQMRLLLWPSHGTTGRLLVLHNLPLAVNDPLLAGHDQLIVPAAGARRREPYLNLDCRRRCFRFDVLDAGPLVGESSLEAKDRRG